MHKIERRFIEVDGRRVHYRKTGEGPPALFLHASPANSAMVLAEMAAAAPYFTCYAFDTPGFGLSDPLPGDHLTIRDLSHATAQAMAALHLPPCPVFGTHTGSSIALELGVGWPERVTGLVLDAPAIFTEAEMAEIFQDFFVSFPPDPLAGHLTQVWMRFRDQFTWFPWKARHVSRLNAVDRPRPEDIQHWVMMFYYACNSYMPAYRAACFFGQGAVRAAAQLTLPATFMATREDMLFGHLDRLPPLKSNQKIVRLPYDTSAKLDSIVAFLRALPSGAASAPSGPVLPAGRGPALQFFDTPAGQIFTRCFGDPAAPAVILVHDAPGSGQALVDLAARLASSAYVILPDLPGTGESEAPLGPYLPACAEAVAAIADALALKRFSLAALGCGCAVAASFAERDDPRVGAILLEQVPEPDEAVAARIAPDIALSPDGAHWLQIWLMLRDGQIYRPWFDGRVAAQRTTQGNFDAGWLHDQTFGLMKSLFSYHLLPRAAYRFDSEAALRRSRQPVQRAPEGGLERLIDSTLHPTT